jgi:hypothetical protein
VLELIEIICLLTLSSILIGVVLNRLLKQKADFNTSLFQSYVSGLIIIYLFILIGIPLNFLIQFLFYFSIISSFYFAYKFYKSGKIKIAPLQLVFLCIFSIIAIYISRNILTSIVYEPIVLWDARSIWYLKAKQLFFANGLNIHTGINNFNAVNFSHPEYPFLVPALGGLLAKYVGYWNEYLPKSNLIFLWIGLLLAFYSLKNMHIIGKLVIFFSLLIISPYQLTTGYMDAWLGIYAALSVLFLMEYIQFYKQEYLVSGLCCILFCNYIKQDAVLLTISIAGSFSILMFAANNKRFIKYTRRRIIKSMLLLVILFLPYLCWSYYKIKWNLSSSEYDFARLTRFSDYNTTFAKAKLALIYQYLMASIEYTKIILVISLAVCASIVYAIISKFSFRTIKNGIVISLFPVFASIIFGAGMFIIYCLSTHDLTWHLNTSADRLRFDLLFLSLPALYGTGGLFFFLPFKRKPVTINKVKNTKHPKVNKNKKN